MFSPYYRRAWRAGSGVAAEHCALNVALYPHGSEGRGCWTMTERGQRHVQRSAERFVIGPSSVEWNERGLAITIDEWANPLPRRVRGTVQVVPGPLTSYVAALDANGRHRWGPIAPCSRVQVRFEQPGLNWDGHAYLDSNEGDEPITEAFTTWDWMRAPMPDGSTVVVYDVHGRAGRDERLIGTRFWPDGRVGTVTLPARRRLARTGWRIERGLRSEAPPGPQTGVIRTLEDTPFYARSLVRTRLAGHEVEAVHETLSATRFGKPWVQALLPWRMPRRG